MGRVRILTLDNKSIPSPGILAAQAKFVEDGHIASADTLNVRWPSTLSGSPPLDELIERLKKSDYDLCIVRTPKNFPNNVNEMDRVIEALGSRRVVLWDGDAWGKGKPMPMQYSWWASVSSQVFTVADSPQSAAWKRLGANDVRLILHVYDHVVFKEAENRPPSPDKRGGIVLIGNNLRRLPVLGGLPGSGGRMKLAKFLHHSSQLPTRIAGRGWPKRFQALPVATRDQVPLIRDMGVSVNWDHFPDYHQYASDRLAISLLAGRPHVTTSHPGTSWMPGASEGLFCLGSPTGVWNKALEILDGDPQRRVEIGQSAWSWSRRRMSTVEAERYLLRMSGVDLPRSAFSTWRNLEM